MALTVQQAAQRLGVTEQEVRRLISTGELAATRFGETGQWSIDDRAVTSRKALRPPPGRPWAPPVAWAALWLLSGLSADWLSVSDRSRLRRRLRSIDVHALMVATRRRAEVATGRVLPEYVGRIAVDADVVRTGVSATVETGADLVSADLVDVYCEPNLRSSLTTRFGIDLTSSNPNVFLRVPAWEAVTVLTDRQVMPAAVVAVDLLDSTDPRTIRAGHDLLAGMLFEVRS